MKVAIYVRSSKDSSDGLSVAAQERTLREWARERGATVAAVYRDTEQSGTLDEASRPGLAARGSRLTTLAGGERGAVGGRAAATQPLRSCAIVEGRPRRIRSP